MRSSSLLCAYVLGLSVLAGCNSSGDGESAAAAIQNALLSADKAMPETLMGTKLFVGGELDRPAVGLFDYEVKVPLWSDGARKDRYVFVPPGARIERSGTNGDYVFPPGTTFVKHFATEQDPNVPIETRVITLKDDGTWGFATYVWNDDGTTELNARPRKITKGGVEYRIPSEQECKMCHGESGSVRGFHGRQLNFTNSSGENQLEVLAGLKIFANTAAELREVVALNDPADATLSTDGRARAYMDVNCSTCHNPEGPDKANLLDLRLDAADTKLLSGGKVVPGKPNDSILWQRITAETERMPLISLRSDPLGLDVLKAYVEQMPE